MAVKSLNIYTLAVMFLMVSLNKINRSLDLSTYRRSKMAVILVNKWLLVKTVAVELNKSHSRVHTMEISQILLRWQMS